MKLSAETVRQVEAHLPAFGAPGVTPAELHRRVGMWARQTIWHVLRDLRAQGRCTFTGEDGSRLYTLAPPDGMTRLARVPS